jgi:hypothetical protein
MGSLHIGASPRVGTDDPAAVEWVRQVETLAPEMWEKLTARRKGAVR